jgi:hypothetical protein
MMWNVISKIIAGVGIGAGIIVASNGTRILNKVDSSDTSSRPVPIPPGSGSDPDLDDNSADAGGGPASLNDAKDAV